MAGAIHATVALVRTVNCQFLLWLIIKRRVPGGRVMDRRIGRDTNLSSAEEIAPPRYHSHLFHFNQLLSFNHSHPSIRWREQLEARKPFWILRKVACPSIYPSIRSVDRQLDSHSFIRVSICESCERSCRPHWVANASRTNEWMTDGQKRCPESAEPKRECRRHVSRCPVLPLSCRPSATVPFCRWLSIVLSLMDAEWTVKRFDVALTLIWWRPRIN